MRHLRTLILMLLLAAALAGAAQAATAGIQLRQPSGSYLSQTVTTVGLTMDGTPLASDVPAFLLNDRTLVPVRVISEDLGATVTWKQDTRQVQIETGRNAVTLTIDSAEAVVNGKPVRLYDGVPATLVKYNGLSRTMVPLRFVTEQLGAAVEFDSSTYTVHITSIQEELHSLTAPRLEDGVVAIRADAALSPSIFSLEGPARVVIDFPGGVLADSSFGALAVENPVIRGVRYNQYDLGYDISRVARVVLDLQEGRTIDDLHIDRSGDLLTVLPASALPEEPEIPEEPPAETPEEPPEETPDEVPDETPAEAPAETPEFDPNVPLVVLDAGHGGDDPGAMQMDLDEKDLVLPMTLAVGALLEEAGLRVEYTRTEDVTVTLAARAEQANTQQADIFVSIHANAFAPKPHIRGLETYYLVGGNRAKILAQCIHEATLASTGAEDREIRTANYYVLHATAMPAVLVETGYMTNEEECALLATEEYRQLLAEGIADGILRYIETVDWQYVPEPAEETPPQTEAQP